MAPGAFFSLGSLGIIGIIFAVSAPPITAERLNGMRALAPIVDANGWGVDCKAPSACSSAAA